MPAVTLGTFPGLDLRDDVQEQPGAVDLLNVDLDEPGRVRSRDGYSKVTAAAGATRYDSIFSVAGAAAVSSTAAIAGTGANDATVVGTAWTNPGNVTADDGSYATVTVALNAHSQYVKGTNFGFAVPGGATIVGIVAEVERNVPAGNAIDFSVRLFKAGVATGSDLAAYSWPATDAVATYGSSSELWGTTWTPADVNAATFGVGISVKGHSAFAVNPQVDYIKIRDRHRHAVLLRRVRLPRHQRRVHRQQRHHDPQARRHHVLDAGGDAESQVRGAAVPDNRLVAANIATIPTGAASTASTSLVHFSDAGPGDVERQQLRLPDPRRQRGHPGRRDVANQHVYVFKSSRFFRLLRQLDRLAPANPVFNYREVDGAGLAAPLGLARPRTASTSLTAAASTSRRAGRRSASPTPSARCSSAARRTAYQSGVINPSALAQASMAWFSDRLYVGLPLGSATTNDHTLVYDPQTKDVDAVGHPDGRDGRDGLPARPAAVHLRAGHVRHRPVRPERLHRRRRAPRSARATAPASTTSGPPSRRSGCAR
jgi:hypothetical protein